MQTRGSSGIFLAFSVLVACGPDGATDAALVDAALADTGVADTGPPPCVPYADPIEVGRISNPAIVETSGVVASTRQTDVLFTHNDSGDSARIFAVSTTGATLAELILEGVTAIDFEDIARAPGPTVDRLLVADIGDNAEARSSVTLYRFDEPTVPGTTRITDIEAIELVYPDAPHDAEAIFVEPASGDVYVLSKHLARPGRIFVARQPLSTTAVNTLVDSGTLPNLRLTGGGITGAVTGADIAPDGSAVALRTYGAVWEWQIETTVAETLLTMPLRLPPVDERQGEAVAYRGDGGGLYTIDEGADPAIYFFGPRACP